MIRMRQVDRGSSQREAIEARKSFGFGVACEVRELDRNK